MMITVKQARAMRAIIEANSKTATDEQGAEAPFIFPAWNVDGVTYQTGDRVQYDGKAYKVLQTHTSQTEWTPVSAVSLFAEILIPDPGVIPVWVQPGADNGYMKGDKVHFPGADDPVYMSTIDNNVWSPSAYPAGWEKVEG